MNTPSASRAETPVLVWDAPVRVFHWLLVLSFAGAFVTAESERWRLVHTTLGWTMLGLVAFRIVWGLVGTRHARFASFVRGPAAAWRHLRGLARGEPAHGVGHNPAGALAIVALLLLALAVGGTGWMLDSGAAGRWVEEGHEAVANLMLAVVGLHVAGVLLASVLSQVNLVRGMVTGRLPGRPEDGIRSAWRSLAALLLVAVLGFWWLQWHGAPGAATVAAERRLHGDDD